MKLDPKALGLAAGLLWGGGLFLLTLLVTFVGGGGHLYLLSKIYFGYSVTPVGAVVGLIWGFVDGLLGGWLLASLYNKLAKA